MKSIYFLSSSLILEGNIGFENYSYKLATHYYYRMTQTVNGNYTDYSQGEEYTETSKDNFKVLPGVGLRYTYNERFYAVGNVNFEYFAMSLGIIL